MNTKSAKLQIAFNELMIMDSLFDLTDHFTDVFIEHLL